MDFDGTIYLGGNLIEGALDFLSRCEEQGVKRYFLSNNSSRSVEQYVAKLNAMKFPVILKMFFFQHMICYRGLLKMKLLEHGQLQQRDVQMMEEVGITPRDDDPQYVVLGYDTEIDYKKFQPLRFTCTKEFHWLLATQTWCALLPMEGFRMLGPILRC